MHSSAPVVSPQAAASQLLYQIATGHWIASALHVVLRLGIIDRFGGESRTAAELASVADVKEDALYRVMRALAAVGIFNEVAPRRFRLAPAGEQLRSGVPGSMYDMALWTTSPFHFHVYAQMLDAVRTGQPAAERVVGMPVFEYLAREAELSEIFNNAMSAFSDVVIPAALEAYDFRGIDVIVDVAGGHGAVLTAILREYPTMRGVLFDLEHVVLGARARIEAAGVGDRCRIEAGNFFKAVPPDADAYIMKHIIHDWDDAQALSILGNIRRAMGKKRARILLLENVLQPGSGPDLGKVVDLEMLMMTGGRERTADDFDALFAKAGFELTRVVPTASPLNVIEARLA